MSWSEELICEKCGVLKATEMFRGWSKDFGPRMATMALRTDSGTGVALTVCPKCGRKKKITLPMARYEEWVEELGRSLIICSKCGKDCKFVSKKLKDKFMMVKMECCKTFEKKIDKNYYDLFKIE